MSRPLTKALRETLALFEEGGPPRTTTEVADRLNIGRRSTYERLERLVDRDRLDTKKVGGNGRVWWRPAEQTNLATPDWGAAASSLVEDVLDDADVGVFVLDSNFEVAWINEATERYFGLERERVLGRDKRTLVNERVASVVEDSSTVADTVLAAYDDNTDAERFECRVIPGDGREERWLEHRSKPIESGAYAGGRVELYYDVTDRKREENSHQTDRKQFESLVEAAEEYAIFLLDTDGHVRTWNPGAARIEGYDADDVVGEHFSTFYTEDDCDASVPADDLAKAASEGRIEDEGWRVRADGSRFRAHVTITAIRDEDGDLEGFAKVTRDVSERRKRERELERYETIVETIRDGIYVVDEDGFFTQVNDAYLSMTGFERGELVGEHVSALVDEETLERASDLETELVDGARTTATLETEFTRPNGDTWTGEATFSLMDAGDGSERIGVVRDVTERVERERTLEEYRRWNQTLVENFPAGAVALVDEDLRYVTFGGTPEGDADLSRDDLEGRPVRDVLPAQIADVVVPRYEAALDGEAAAFEDTIDGRIYEFHFVPVRDDDGDVFAVTAMSRDITDRKERERYLEDAKSQLEAATEAGAVGTFEWHVQNDEMVTGPSFAETFGVDPDDAREGVSIDRFVAAIHEDDRERVERSAEAAFESCGEFEEEYRVRDADGEVRWVVTRGRIECDDDGDPVTFPGALTDITERKAAEIELEQQRERLAALNELNGVVREITGAVIDQSSREEIETIVCERLADSESYLFAWIGDRDVATNTVNLRAEAGVDGYLDDVTIPVDPDDERSEGATGRALRTGETQTTHDVRDDDRHDPWRGKIEQSGFRSSAAIPIVHEETTYGVLNLYAERPNAFEGKERDVVDQLGEVVGHAIGAVERKRALMSDEVVELQFQVDDVFESLDVDASRTEPIHLEQAVPVDDGDYVFFGRTTPAGADTVEAMVETIPSYEDVTFRAADDETVFELRVSEPPIMSVVAPLGGSVPEAVIEDGDCRLTVHLSPSADVRHVIDSVTEVYPTVELLKRRQRSIRDQGEPAVPNVLSRLTPRQRSALETAFHAGFFEWPRDASGEDVASLLDVSPPTFHQHLRKAERKVYESLLSSTTPA